MKPIFCGNFEYDARQSELERLFGKYGKVDRVDMKTGFAFIYMEDERDAEDAIRALDRKEFGRQGRRLRVEWTKQERGIKRPGGGGGGGSRKSTNNRPSKTLFVINFDPHNTKTRDLERHFDSYGKIASVRIRRNFAFVQYECVEDASKALDATNMSKLMDRVISVEYAVRVDDEKRDRYSPERSRDRSPERGRDRSLERGRDRRRSLSPYRRRERGSPDYGRNRSRSPYRKEGRVSPDYGRARSPSPRRSERERTHHDLDRSRTRREVSSDRGRGTSTSPRGRDRASTPTRREKVSSERGRGTSSSPRGRDIRASSATRRENVSSDRERGTSPSPRGRDRASSPSNGRDTSTSPYGRKRQSPENGHDRGSSPSPSPVGRDGASLDNSVPKARDDGPNEDGPESPVNESYQSRSPQQEE